MYYNYMLHTSASTCSRESAIRFSAIYVKDRDLDFNNCKLELMMINNYFTIVFQEAGMIFNFCHEITYITYINYQMGVIYKRIEGTDGYKAIFRQLVLLDKICIAQLISFGVICYK